MRILASVCAAVCVLPSSAPVQEPKAPDIIAEVRQALGGSAALAAVTSFSIQAAGESREYGLVRYSVQIDCQLPDKLVVTRMQSEQGRTLIERDGINVHELIRQTISMPPQPPLPAPAPGMPRETAETKAADRDDQLLQVRQWFAALTLILFARSVPVNPLELQEAGSADFQDAPARVVEGRVAGGGVVRLFVDPASHLPMAVSWLGTRRHTGIPGVPAMSPPDEAALALTLAPVEHQLCAGDHRKASGLNWPRLLVEYEAGREVENMVLRSIKINSPIPADRFKVSQ